jgi:hypothetical protein
LPESSSEHGDEEGTNNAREDCDENSSDSSGNVSDVEESSEHKDASSMVDIIGLYSR